MAINPVTNQEIPVWVSDYVISSYGTGAIMAVPGKDERDRDFAKRYQIPITPTTLSAKPEGKMTTHYHLRDWLISRQRYWGAPIPMIHCDTDGWIPVEEKDLPIKLPYIEDYKPIGTGVAPLAQDPDFVNTPCPKCGKPAKRETDVCDTFLDSSWYFLRYPSVGDETQAFDPEITEKWLPVDMYIGGAEHSVLHLLYARFVTMVLYDQKLLSFEEPFTKFRAHGLLIKDGAKMSKSRGNVINPDDYIAKYGADTLRCYLMFLGPFDQGGDFRDSGIEGMERFLKKVRRLVEDNLASKKQSKNASDKDSSATDLDSSSSRAVKFIAEDLKNLRYNTALAKFMIFINDLTASKENIEHKHLEILTLILAPFAPFLSEELWEKLGKEGSIHSQSWPEFDESKTSSEIVTVAVQINGRTRGVISVLKGMDQVELEKLAKENDNVAKHLLKEPKKVIFVQDKILNFVVG
jgi:leucyl-tRNA synthetase